MGLPMIRDEEEDNHDQLNTRRNGYGRGRRMTRIGLVVMAEEDMRTMRIKVSGSPTHGGRRPSFESTPLPDRPPYKVHVSNLPLDCKEHHLPNFLSKRKAT